LTLAPGTRLGVYDIISLIGEGGMGQVYRARDTKLNRDVAIKVLPESFAHDADRVARFTREAQTLASLNHPNIATIYGIEDCPAPHASVGGSQHIGALVMELVEGDDLSKRIAQGALPMDEALPIAKQIADALEAAHEQGIMHRDLKPANIKVRTDGTVKMLDFGLAKILEGGAAGRLGRAGEARLQNLSQSPTIAPAMMTGAGMILGTTAYMSPEQARGKAVDTRADIWAFGCVLFEMLTGRTAFGGDTMTDVLAAIVKNEPEWQALPAGTPPIVRSLLRRCLQKDPAERLRHAGDARLEIREAIAEPVTSSHASSLRSRGMRSAVVVPWALAAMLALALGWLVMRAGLRRATLPAPATTRTELNLPSGVELYSGFAQNLAISPDGTRVAFIGILGGVRSLYVRRLDQFEAVAIPGTPTISSCFFSPDGLAVGFRSSDGTVKKVSLGDGLVQTLSRDADPSGNGGAWGTDDRVTFVRGGALWQVSASEGPARQLTTLAAEKHETSQSWPTVVGGGRAILFTSVTGPDRGAAHIEVVKVSTGERHVVVDSGSFPLYAASGHLIFFRDGALLAAPFDVERLEVTGPTVRVVPEVPVDRSGAPLAALSSAGVLVYQSTGTLSQVVWVSRQGVEQPITDTPRLYTTPRLAPDGDRVLVHVNGDLWIQDAARRRFTRLTSNQTVGNTFPVWTPDGSRVVFKAGPGLRWMDTDGSGRSQDIPQTTTADYPSSVSQDGGTLAFTRLTSDSSADIEVLSLRDEPQPRPLVKTSAYEGGADFSPNGQWVAYSSDESGQMQVYVRPFPRGDGKAPVSTQGGRDVSWRIPVSTQGGRAARWSGNSKELFYRDGNKMMAVSVSGGSDGSQPTFSSPRMLFEQRYASGAAVTVANYDVSADGERFVMIKDESGSGRLNVVLNWFDELTRLAPPKR
jgi:serine/threonine-protein kinase